MNITSTDHRILRRLAVLASMVVVLAMLVGMPFVRAVASVASPLGPDYAALVTAHRPVVIINGQLQQLPTGDYLSSVGGLTTNANAASTGDIETTTETVSTTLTAQGQVSISGSIAPSAFTGAQVNNYAPTGLATTYVIDQSVTSDTDITGLTAQPAGTQIDFRNISTSTNTLTFKNASGSSSASNRFTLSGGVDWKLPPGCSILFRHNGTDWRMIALITTEYPSVKDDGALTVGAGATVVGGTTVDSLNVGVIAPVSLSASQNDYNPTGLQTATIIQLSATTQLSITGIAAPTGSVGGRYLCVENTSSSTISFLHASASSSAANRFVMNQGLTWQLPGTLAGSGGGTLCFFYDFAASRWTQISHIYYPKLNAGSSGQFAVAASGAVSTTTAALSGFSNVQAATASAFSVVDSIGFATAATPMVSYGVNSLVTTTRSSGTGALTNVGGYFSATSGQVNDALVADAGDVLLNQTSGVVGIGATPQIISTGTPTANHGSLGTGSTNWVGNVTSVGANTSVTLTYSPAFTNRSWCFAQPNSVAAPEIIYVTNSASAPVFSCVNSTLGTAANCDDFSYQCIGQ